MLHVCIQKFDMIGTVKNLMLHACASIAALCASTVDPIKKAWQRKAVGSACTSMNDRPEFTEGNKSKVTDSSTVFLLQGRLLISVHLCLAWKARGVLQTSESASSRRHSEDC